MDVKLIPIKQIKEYDGNLVVAESIQEVPFQIKRVFCIFDVPPTVERGNHASKNSAFFYVCLRGAVKINVDDGKEKKNFDLNRSDVGLYLPPGIWMKIFDFSKDAVFLVLASETYSDNKYYEDYQTFIKEKANV